MAFLKKEVSFYLIFSEYAYIIVFAIMQIFTKYYRLAVHIQWIFPFFISLNSSFHGPYVVWFTQNTAFNPPL